MEAVEPYAERWIVLPDTQIPFEDHKTLLAVEAYMRDVQMGPRPFKGWLQLGDFIDFPQLSKFIAGYESSSLGLMDVWEDFEAGNRFLDRHQAIMRLSGEPFRMVLLEGNHDYRAYDFAQKNPKLEKILDFERNLRLEERGIEFVPCWREGKLFSRGNAYFTHGQYVNKYHAAKMVDTYGKCIFYGHVHDVMEFPKVTHATGETYVGKSLGCLCDPNQHYLKGKPTNWTQAFAVFTFFEDGFFQEETIKIFKNRFYSRETGKVYDGNALVKQ